MARVRVMPAWHSMKGPRRALMIEDVLECIFEQLVIRDDSSSSILEDVKSCRLVCHTWKKSMTRMYRNIQSPTSFNTEYIWKGGVKSPTMLFDAIVFSSLPPIRRIHFNEGYFYGEDANSLLTRLLLLLKEGLTELLLECTPCQLGTIETLHLPEIRFPSLRKLQFGIVHRYTDAPFNLSPFGLLLCAAPELTEFKLEFSKRDIGQGLDNYRLYTLKTRTVSMICRRLPLTVKTLTISGAVLNARSLHLLSRRGVRLESLDLCIHPDPLAIQSTHTLLTTQRNSLRKCSLHGLRAEQSDEKLLSFPILSQLRTLELDGVGVSPFPFATNLPRIEQLEVFGMDTSTFGQQLKETKIGSWMTKLELPSDFLRHPELVHLLPSRFPALHSLHIRIYPEMRECVAAMENIYVRLGEQLKSLAISIYINYEPMDLNLDPILCGFDEGICQQLATAPNFDDLDLDELQTRPSLRSMKGLRKLEIKCLSLRYLQQLHLSNLSAHHVFLPMTELEELTLPRSAKRQMSAEYISRMERKFTKYSFDSYRPPH